MTVMTMQTMNHSRLRRPHTVCSGQRRAAQPGRRLVAPTMVAIAAVVIAAQPVRADWPSIGSFGWPFTGWSGWSFGCQSCGPCGGAAHQSTPYGDMGCGPKYCGAVHDDPCGVDPCDSCNRWSGCNGARQGPDMLAPWQLPPCRGFQSAAQVGYDGSGGGGICTDCRRPAYLLW
jgi:hypothetical protein